MFWFKRVCHTCAVLHVLCCAVLHLLCCAVVVGQACDFESGMCNWYSVAHPTKSSRFRRDAAKNQYSWIIVKGSSVNDKDDKPQSDHTLGTSAGKYTSLYVNSHTYKNNLERL